MTKLIDIWRRLSDGIMAGIMMAVGATVFLACNTDSYIGKYGGALFFSVALICICIKGYSLYTGKIGYLLDKHSKDDISVLLLGLLGNAIATIALGYLIALAIPSIKDSAVAVVEKKLAFEYWQALIRAIMCGVLVYLAVDIYRENKSMLGIIFCIPTFILCGFEHSIANIFYFAASGIASWQSFLFILVVIAGNSIGSLIIPLLKLPKSKQQN